MEDTGLTVNEGDLITITASGSVRYDSSSPSVGPNGISGSASGSSYVVTDPSIPACSLVGNIANSSTLDGKGFFVGSAFADDVPIRNTTSRTGKLFLGFNDGAVYTDRSGYDSWGFRGDNSGSFTVYIEISRNSSTTTPTPTSTDDHGNSRSNATSVSSSSSTPGRLETGGDIDYFSFSLSQSGSVTIQTSSSIDTYGILYNSSGNTIEEDDDDGPDNNFQISRSLNSGTYYVKVRGYSSDITGSYTLVISTTSSSTTTPTPTVTADVSEMPIEIIQGAFDQAGGYAYFTMRTRIPSPRFNVPVYQYSSATVDVEVIGPSGVRYACPPMPIQDLFTQQVEITVKGIIPGVSELITIFESFDILLRILNQGEENTSQLRYSGEPNNSIVADYMVKLVGENRRSEWPIRIVGTVTYTIRRTNTSPTETVTVPLDYPEIIR